jgi:hypothetical protein
VCFAARLNKPFRLDSCVNACHHSTRLSSAITWHATEQKQRGFTEDQARQMHRLARSHHKRSRPSWTTRRLRCSRDTDPPMSRPYKLTRLEEHEIYVLYQYTGNDQRELAGRYGVSQSLISLITRKERWKDRKRRR